MMFSRIIVTKKIHKWNIQFQKYEMKRYMDGSVGTRNSIAWYSLFVVRRHVVGPHIMFPKFKYYKYYTYHREKLHQRRYRKTRAKKIWPYTSFIRSPNHWNHGRLAVSSIWLDSYLQHLSVWTTEQKVTIFNKFELEGHNTILSLHKDSMKSVINFSLNATYNIMLRQEHDFHPERSNLLFCYYSG